MIRLEIEQKMLIKIISTAISLTIAIVDRYDIVQLFSLSCL